LVRGEVFRIGRLDDSSCAILAVAGGIAATPFLGSTSTYVRGGIGGVDGRALRAGDVLPLTRDAVNQGNERRLPSSPGFDLTESVRVVLGPQDDHFTKAAIDIFLGTEWRISASSDRMGLRLDGPPLSHREGHDIVSDGVPMGAIQVP